MNHTVSQGECLSSISAGYGLPWQLIWDYGPNAALKAKRKNPNVLEPGDVLSIPDKQQKTVSRSTGQTHRFVVKDTKTLVKIRLTMDDKPRSGLPFALYANDVLLAKGTTDGDGIVSAKIAATTHQARLEVTDKNIVDIYQLRLGEIDPIETAPGVSQRLHNLGYDVRNDLREAIRSFQARAKLPVTGEVDSTTLSQLEKAYGL